MASPEVKRKMLSLGIFCAPVLIVQATAAILGRGAPSAVSASAAPSTDGVPVSSRAIAWTSTQLAASARIAELNKQPFEPTPFLYDFDESRQPVEKELTETAEVSSPDQPTFHLQAVMSTANDRQALINGRPYRQGQMIRSTTWTVLSIDVEARQALLRDSQTENTITVRVELTR